MSRVLATIAGLSLSAALAMGFGWLFCWWLGLSGDMTASVLIVYAAATAVALVLLLAGQLFRIMSHAYYIAVSGAVFLAVDLVIWQLTGIMPAARFVRGGFVPAAIMGLVIGVLFRVVAVPVPDSPRDPRA